MKTTFVGKSIRQWSPWRIVEGHPTWTLMDRDWSITIVHVDDSLLGFRWNVYRRETPQRVRSAFRGRAVTLHEAEQAAERAVLDNIEPSRGTCAVCGSSASTRRMVGGPVQYRAVLVCDHHSAVCRAHLKDPCPECDAR